MIQGSANDKAGAAAKAEAAVPAPPARGLSKTTAGDEAAKGASAPSEAAKPGAAAKGQPAPAPAIKDIPTKVLGETLYDRITSGLMASVVGAMLVVGWLGLIIASDRAYASRATPPIKIIEVFGGGGGSPDGTPGSMESIDVAGADAGPFASNSMEEAGEFEEPAVAQTPSVMLDFVGEAADGVTEADVQTAQPTGGAVATGKRSSKIGTGGPAFGYGPGDGGVPREQRWSIVYNPGQSVDDYARQLDAFGIELASVVSGTLQYASHFTENPPRKRSGSSSSEGRLYFLWRGQGRKTSDLELLRRAGIDVGEGSIFQFYPVEVENTLAQLEVKFRNRQPGEIRMTRFAVVPSGQSYTFEVVSQEPLR